jgi:hypothetical protein
MRAKREKSKQLLVRNAGLTCKGDKALGEIPRARHLSSEQ